jgi:hypothetical protein
VSTVGHKSSDANDQLLIISVDLEVDANDYLLVSTMSMLKVLNFGH